MGAAVHGVEENVPLGTADLQRFMERHSIAGAVVPPLNGAPPPTGCCEVKSLVFVVDGRPLVRPLCVRAQQRTTACSGQACCCMA